MKTTTTRYAKLTDNQVVRRLGTARLAQDTTSIESLTEEITHRIIINAAHVEASREEDEREEAKKPTFSRHYFKELELTTAHVAAIAEDINRNTITIDINSELAAAMSTVVVELAHREALAENIERDTLSNIEETQRMDTEADEREQIADDLEAVAAFMDRNNHTEEQ